LIGAGIISRTHLMLHGMAVTNSMRNKTFAL